MVESFPGRRRPAARTAVVPVSEVIAVPVSRLSAGELREVTQVVWQATSQACSLEVQMALTGIACEVQRVLDDRASRMMPELRHEIERLTGNGR